MYSPESEHIIRCSKTSIQMLDMPPRATARASVPNFLNGFLSRLDGGPNRIVMTFNGM